jgi:hypothetical protein
MLIQFCRVPHRRTIHVRHLAKSGKLFLFDHFYDARMKFASGFGENRIAGAACRQRLATWHRHLRRTCARQPLSPRLPAASPEIPDVCRQFPEPRHAFPARCGKIPPVAAFSWPLAGKSRPVATGSRSVAAPSRNHAGKSRLFAADYQPLAGNSRTLAGNSQSVAGKSCAPPECSQATAMKILMNAAPARSGPPVFPPANQKSTKQQHES